MDSELPLPEHRLFVERVSALPNDAAEWTGNAATREAHHGLVSLNKNPFFVRLLWQSDDAQRTAEVGLYKIRLGALSRAGYVQKKERLQVRLRFVRKPNGIIGIQSNSASPFLPIGQALV
jgi:hypothetical protein